MPGEKGGKSQSMILTMQKIYFCVIFHAKNLNECWNNVQDPPQLFLLVGGILY